MLLAPLTLLAGLAVSQAQQPAGTNNLCDPKYWSADQGPAKPVPPPIVPERWLVVPKESNASVALVFGSRLLDTGSPAPTAGTDGIPWKSADSKRPAGIVAAFTRITCEHDEIRMARLSGAQFLFVNGEGFVGDLDGRGFRGVPVALKKGDNDLYVLGVPDAFELELWCPQTRVVLASWDVAWVGDNPIADDIAYPVFNASLAPAPDLHVHYGHARAEGSTCDRGIGDWRCGGPGIMPLGVRMGGSYFYGLDECDPRDSEVAALVPVCVSSSADSDPDGQWLRCPPASERKKSRAAALPLRAPSVFLGSPISPLGTEIMLVHPQGELLARARFDQLVCWYRAWFTPATVAAETLVSVAGDRPDQQQWEADQAWSFPSFVVYGNAETNAAWARFVPDDFSIQVHDGHLTVNGKHYASDDICGWFQLRAPSGKRVVVQASTGARGSRLAYVVQPLFARSDGLDYCFWDASGPGGTPHEFTSGKFEAPKAAPRDR